MLDAAASPKRVKNRALRKFLRNPLAVIGAVLIVGLVLAAVFALWVAPFSLLELDLINAYQTPGTGGHLLGTDNFGRDILSRLIYGSRISLLISLWSALLQLSGQF